MREAIDYTPFYLVAEKKLQQTYTTLKNNHYKEAAMLLDDLLAEVRLLQVAVKSHIREEA